MSPFLLTMTSITITFMLHQFLKGVFALIEKAHEDLRESDRRIAGGELVIGMVD